MCVCLCVEQVVKMCWDNRLYDAMIYVFNSGMNDYINPMEVEAVCACVPVCPLGACVRMCVFLYACLCVCV